MSITTVGLVAWGFGPAVILIALVAWLSWRDRRQWRKDERAMRLLLAIEESWELPPAERRR